MELHIDPRIGAAVMEQIEDDNNDIKVNVIIIALPTGNVGDEVEPTFISNLSPEGVISVMQDIGNKIIRFNEPTVADIFLVTDVDEIKH